MMLGNTHERAKKKIALCLSQSAFSNFFLCKKKRNMENPGMDPGTSRMLSGRSTTCDNSPIPLIFVLPLFQNLFRGLFTSH